MMNLRYPENQLSLQRLVQRKVSQWSNLDYISGAEAKDLSEKYLDKRRSATVPVRTLLFLATTILLLGGTFLIGLLISELNPFVLFIIGTSTLFIYEVYVGKKFYQVGIDKAFILVGGLLLIVSILWMFDKYKIESPFQFLISAVLVWVIAIRYHNYIAFYSAFVLLQTYFFEYVRMDFPFTLFILVSIVSTLCVAFFFSKRRKTLPPFAQRWNETLEVFFLLMVAAFLNPFLQESLYSIFKGKSFSDPLSYFNEYALLLMIFLSGIFAITLMILGIFHQVRAYIIVAISTIFVGFLTIWHYFWQEWNENVIYTIYGISITSIGLFLNSFLKKPRWKLTSKKIAHQNNLTDVFETIRKISEKKGLNG
jgi:hypothetical protein